MFKFSQKGVSLYITVVILSVILAVVLGLSTILVAQIKMVRGIGYSVVAIYAADTGVEQALAGIYSENYESSYEGSLLDDQADQASYTTEVACCAICGDDCKIKDTNGDSILDPNCTATKYCIRSTGKYKNTSRAIEVGL